MNGGRRLEITSLADGDIDRHFNDIVEVSLVDHHVRRDG